MSKKKVGSSSKNGRDSNSKRMGFKKYSNQIVFPGNIILRQRGSKFLPGNNVGIGNDYTLFSLKKGFLKFIRKNNKKYVNVINEFS